MDINHHRQVAIIKTSDNPDGHIIMREGTSCNYDSVHIALAEYLIEQACVNSALIIDCSHSNSNKDYTRQSLVACDVKKQILEGNQPSSLPQEEMKYGILITDACISWETTDECSLNWPSNYAIHSSREADRQIVRASTLLLVTKLQTTKDAKGRKEDMG